MKRDTLLDFFADFAGLPGTFLMYDDGLRIQSRGYRQTAAAARELAGRLREAGVGQGDRVLIWSENRPECIAAFWASLLAGAVVVPAAEFLRDLQAGARFLCGCSPGSRTKPATPVRFRPRAGSPWVPGTRTRM